MKFPYDGRRVAALRVRIERGACVRENYCAQQQLSRALIATRCVRTLTAASAVCPPRGICVLYIFICFIYYATDIYRYGTCLWYFSMLCVLYGVCVPLGLMERTLAPATVSIQNCE